VNTAFQPIGSSIRQSRYRSFHVPDKSSIRHVKAGRPALSLQGKLIEDEQFVENALLKNCLFTDLSDSSMKRLIDGFEKGQASKDEVIITQGDSCDGGYVYLIREGECRVFVNGRQVPKPFGKIGSEVIFGERGILHQSTRTSTVIVKSDAITYYKVPGDLFQEVVQPSFRDSSATMREIDALISQLTGTDALYGGDVILQYKPERTWLLQQFGGTVLRISLDSTLVSIVVCLAFVLLARDITGQDLLNIGAFPPDNSDPFIHNLSRVKSIWSIQQSLATFILTFFVNQGFDFWKKIYGFSRDLQGALGDVNLLISANIKRGEDGVPTAEATEFVKEIAQFTRLYHMLMWASKTKRFAPLITPEGLKRMQSRGLMTIRQLEVLQNLETANDLLFSAPQQWMLIRSTQAMDEGILAADTPTRGKILGKMLEIGAKEGAISDSISGRMPLAYVHLVQIQVDALVIFAPLALYPELGDYAIPAVGIITLFYTGLMNLGKIFLDPLNNEEFCGNSIFMDIGVFVREGNVASTQFREGAEELPF